MRAGQVRLEDIGKHYGDLWAVRHINLEVARGEFYTLLGPSGCGKTTLLRTIAGFIAPDEGAVFLDGEPVTRVPPWKRNIGMVFQNYALWPHMTVFENVAFGLRERRFPRGEIQRRVLEVLEQVGLKGTEQRRPSQLSGGQQQRVALARTLVIQPRLLLLDEPLSNLDAKLRQEMRIELLKLQRDIGLTTIYVTHDQEEALTLSTRIAVMNLGQIIQEGKPREIYESPRDRFVTDFVGKSNLFSGTIMRSLNGILEIETSEGFRIQARPPAAGKAGEAKKLLLYVRPEAIDLIDKAAGAPGTNRITGRVVASAYQGPLVEYEVEAGSRIIRVNVINPKGKRLFQRGEETTIAFAAEDVGIIPE
ncbi:MAG TPA: ABC transporter ATP-binding protein [Candidatus Eisenbacteria bacterium]|nr:ABC transporter ATP-binding protein [Candidatus Eisenbacteria bacterium]